MNHPNRIQPAPNQESVWDYPRPPRLEDVLQRIRVVFRGVTLADTTHAKRVLETSHPPVYYLPPEDIQKQYLLQSPRGSMCEWKGAASYYSIKVGDQQVNNAAWYYPNPTPAFGPIKDYVAFYAGLMEACYVGDELVIPQPGGFYGGWITSNIVGPFKGEPGTNGW
jgi:uncharacterized protein (DUF427 family)